MDLPVWQSVQAELADAPFTFIAVALDEPEAARRWIEPVNPGYPCAIDREHRVAEVFNLVNVPQAIWIDEEGRVVRGPHSAGATDGFRAMDRVKFTMPEAAMAERVRVRDAYYAALRDWARQGAASRFAQAAPQVAATLRPPGEAVAQAHAHFRLGQYLRASGREAEATEQFDEATRLHPDSWAMWRQAAPKDPRGLASGPAFWARVDALGERHYYEPMPEDLLQAG